MEVPDDYFPVEIDVVPQEVPAPSPTAPPVDASPLKLAAIEVPTPAGLPTEPLPPLQPPAAEGTTGECVDELQGNVSDVAAAIVKQLESIEDAAVHQASNALDDVPVVDDGSSGMQVSGDDVKDVLLAATTTQSSSSIVESCVGQIAAQIIAAEDVGIAAATAMLSSTLCNSERESVTMAAADSGAPSNVPTSSPDGQLSSSVHHLLLSIADYLEAAIITCVEAVETFDAMEWIRQHQDEMMLLACLGVLLIAVVVTRLRFTKYAEALRPFQELSRR